MLEKIKNKLKNKKGFKLGDMLPLGMTIVTVGIALSLGLTVLGDFADSNAECSTGTYNDTSNICYNASNTSQTFGSPTNTAYNGTVNAEDGLVKFTNYLPTIALVVVVSIIIGIIVRYMFFNNGMN